MSVTFSCVVMLIADLDRPMQGALRLSQQPMIELQKQLRSAGP